MNSITNLSPGQLRRAADIKERIDSLQNQLIEILGGEAPAPAVEAQKPKKRTFSALTRARMKAAQQARWAAKRSEAQPVPTSVTPAAAPRKSKVSEARLQALAKARAARWAKAKKGKKAKKAVNDVPF
jgi:hypothetical protein